MKKVMMRSRAAQGGLDWSAANHPKCSGRIRPDTSGTCLSGPLSSTIGAKWPALQSGMVADRALTETTYTVLYRLEALS